MSRVTNWKTLRGKKAIKKKKKREGRSNPVGVMCGVDSKKWGKLNKDKRKFDLLHQRKSIDFGGVTMTSVQTFVFKEENKEEFTEKRKWKKVHRV